MKINEHDPEWLIKQARQPIEDMKEKNRRDSSQGLKNLAAAAPLLAVIGFLIWLFSGGGSSGSSYRATAGTSGTGCLTADCSRVVEAAREARRQGLTDSGAFLNAYERDAIRRESEAYDRLLR